MSGPLTVGSERSHKEKAEVPGSPEKAWGVGAVEVVVSFWKSHPAVVEPAGSGSICHLS